jgi:nitroimidazol reductase NimA-like FMN-containing flavoprotein (pyridoxamine 5'-phosphate oxidase superfamily)
MALDPSELEALVGDGGECVFSWSTSQGYPVGVVMAYVYRHGSFWTNCAARRKRVAALRARPQAAVVVNRDGKMASYKGDSVIHSPETSTGTR